MLPARAVLSLLLVLSLSAAKTIDMGIFNPECLVGKPVVYNQGESVAVPWFTINLDLPPEQRWVEIASIYKEKMSAALKTVLSLLNIIGDGILVDILEDAMKTAAELLPSPYKEEIHAMAQLTGLPLEHLTLLNLFYEVQKGCTSLVAEDAQGHITHARNLDFGTFFVWDGAAAEWQLSQNLRALVVNLEFKQGGATLFKGVTFAGHLGLITGLKPNAFTITTNTRFGNTFKNLYWFLHEGLQGRKFILYANRDVLTAAKSYEEALNMIVETKLLANGYFILGGVNPGEGAVITHGFNQTDHIERIDTSKPNGWYVLETNYDWDKEVLFLDDRRAPGNGCMRKLGQANANHVGIYQVLSSKPSLNKATVHTTVMSARTGMLETYIRHCPHPCWFV